jgi:hypothetical protein
MRPIETVLLPMKKDSYPLEEVIQLYCHTKVLIRIFLTCFDKGNYNNIKKY